MKLLISISTFFIITSSFAQRDKWAQKDSLPGDIRTIVHSTTFAQKIKNLFSKTYYFTKTIIVKDSSGRLKYYVKMKVHNLGCLLSTHDKYKFTQYNLDKTITIIEGRGRETYLVTIKKGRQMISKEQIDENKVRGLTHSLY